MVLLRDLTPAYCHLLFERSTFLLGQAPLLLAFPPACSCNALLIKLPLPLLLLMSSTVGLALLCL